MMEKTGCLEKDRILSTERGPSKSPPFLRNITIIARLWALVTLSVMWAAAITTVKSANEKTSFYIGWYLVGAGAVVTWFEMTWMIDKSGCCRRDGCCCSCWRIIMWVDNWKKGILYLVLAVPVFLEGMRMVLGIVSGFFLVICGLLYILKTFKEGIVYTVTETRYIKTYTPRLNVVTHEIETQTEDDKYYTELYQATGHQH